MSWCNNRYIDFLTAGADLGLLLRTGGYLSRFIRAQQAASSF
jgi:hypothetical protein